MRSSREFTGALGAEHAQFITSSRAQGPAAGEPVVVEHELDQQLALPVGGLGSKPRTV